MEADPAEAADALARRAAGAALAGRTGEAQGLLKAAEGLRRAAEAALPAAGRWDDAAQWDDEEPRASDARNWRRVGAEADAPGWADPPADPRDRRPCDGPVVAALPWTDARPPCTAGTCYVRASEAVIEGALAQMAVLFDREPDKASARAQAHALNLVERLGRLAASGLPEQARALYAAGWAMGLAEGPGSGGAPGAAAGASAGAAAGGTAWEGAGSDAVPFPPPEPQAMSTNKHPSAGHEPDPLPADDLATNPGIGETRGVTRAGGLTQEREDPADIEGDNTVEGDVDQDVDRGGGISPDHRGRTNK